VALKVCGEGRWKSVVGSPETEVRRPKLSFRPQGDLPAILPVEGWQAGIPQLDEALCRRFLRRTSFEMTFYSGFSGEKRRVLFLEFVLRPPPLAVCPKYFAFYFFQSNLFKGFVCLLYTLICLVGIR